MGVRDPAVRFGACTALAVLLLPPIARGQAADWPHWRGPNRNDVTVEKSGWHDGRWMADKPRWTAEVGQGCTSPIVVGDRVYVMGWHDGRDHVRCLDARTGKPIWMVTYRCPQYGRHAVGDEDAYAGPTSTPDYDADTGYLYTLSSDGDLHCWNTRAQGSSVWSFNLYDRLGVGQRPAIHLAKNDLRDYGYTTSPYVHGNWVLVEVGARRGTVMAFDKRTGQRQWASAYTGPAGHTGGLVPLTVEGIPCVAVLTLYDLLVLRLDRGHAGQTVATYPWKTAWAENVLTPTVQGDSVLICSEHTHHSICKIRITLRGARKVWEQPYSSHVGSPTVAGRYIYLASARLLCLDGQTGRPVWQGGSYGTGGACILTGDGRIIVWSDQGRVTLVEAASRAPTQYHQLARIPRVFFGNQAWSHPALANGLLYCKDRLGHLKCFSTTESHAVAPRDLAVPHDRQERAQDTADALPTQPSGRD